LPSSDSKREPPREGAWRQNQAPSLREAKRRSNLEPPLGVLSLALKRQQNKTAAQGRVAAESSAVIARSEATKQSRTAARRAVACPQATAKENRRARARGGRIKRRHCEERSDEAISNRR